ncbi:unnamed protein product [Triticum turgidum subsp. durum]|uniref:Ubiquitin-like domain-containing protein n=1 Tax=Triticum turgidum subsp. durum TaxID=4567 RepID=A0A9R0XDY3_TRITD|nr:unnamed protein product [Triticum turgidum subsp. durum]
MLVQKRDPDSDAPAGAPVPTVRLKVKFNGVSHEIYINSQASFGELKKMMSEKTGLHHEDQKVLYKGKVALTEALMTELVKLDAIAADGEVKAQRRLQEKRVQKYVETLDVIRAKNASAPTANGHVKNAAAPKANGNGNGQAKGDRSLHLPPRPPPVSQRRQFKQQPAPANGKAAAAPPTASWETFDLLSSMPSTSSATATTTMAAATTTTKPATNNNTTSPIPRFDWELF